MQSIKITRYMNPILHGWSGYLEPADGSWIAFVGLDGAPRFFLHRDSLTGAILPDDPALRADHLDRLSAAHELRIGMADDGTSGLDSLEVGELVFPLGDDGRAGLRCAGAA